MNSCTDTCLWKCLYDRTVVSPRCLGCRGRVNPRCTECMVDETNWKLACGTGKLLSRIAGDGDAQVRLHGAVRSVTSCNHGVTVTLNDESEFTARAAVVAVPANVWAHLGFSPPLTEAQVEASRAGMQASYVHHGEQVSRGLLVCVIGKRARQRSRWARSTHRRRTVSMIASGATSIPRLRRTA
ncbi:FAD-dependent oxidoreductase [Nocardia rhamnosiphila]|uniref:FAD-dependent oxidoreductase n=1 Tax=Nocardia rhamnosiphila TaxID=426716 RepID=UPI0033DFC796